MGALDFSIKGVLGVHVGQRVVGRRGEPRASGFVELRFVFGNFSFRLFRLSV